MDASADRDAPAREHVPGKNEKHSLNPKRVDPSCGKRRKDRPTRGDLQSNDERASMPMPPTMVQTRSNHRFVIIVRRRSINIAPSSAHIRALRGREEPRRGGKAKARRVENRSRVRDARSKQAHDASQWIVNTVIVLESTGAIH
uniref:Uncharacterized protein n=1 Tax=Micromonas pusilla TaxID=38833 RepID=A0A7S0PUV9_MICPS